MVILGLGSNLGDRLEHLRNAFRLIKKIPEVKVQQVSPVYMSDALLEKDAPPEWNTPYLNLALRCETTLTPHELLHHTKNIEKELGRDTSIHWGPRPVDIDLLCWDEKVIFDDKLHIPHEHLHERPFALWPLADVAPRWIYPLRDKLSQNYFFGKTATEIAEQWPSRFSGDAPLHTKQISQRIDTPQLVAILNVTPDSFSNDGDLQTEKIVQQAKILVEQGADVLDIGAEASNPKAIPIDAKTEWQRLEPVLKKLIATRKDFFLSPKISVDTRHHEVAEQALNLGVDWINDVSGLTDPGMQSLLKDQACDVVMMHHLGLPASQSHWLAHHQDATQLVLAWGEKQIRKLEKLGFNPDRLIFDIGIGFGKKAHQSLDLIQNIEKFSALNLRLLVGHSRKSFLKQFTPKVASERDMETLPISLHLAKKNVAFLRIHNVELCSRTLKVHAAL